MDHYQHEKTRGVEFVSAMHKAMTGVENFPLYSPTCVVKTLSQEKLDRWRRVGLCRLLEAVLSDLWVVLFLSFPDCLRSLWSTGSRTSLFRWSPPQSSRRSSPLVLRRCLSTCFLESITRTSPLTSCCPTGASTSGSTRWSSRSGGPLWKPAESTQHFKMVFSSNSH